MANGHIPGRVNPFQQIGQTLAERQQQGLQAVQDILAGRLPQVPGLGAGWMPDIRTINQFADLAIEELQRNPMADLSAFEQAFIQPLLSSSLPGQLVALDYYSRKAAQTGNLGAFPFAQLPLGSMRGISAAAQALSRLAPEFHFDPNFRNLVGQFVSSLVPSGQAATLPTSLLSAVAAPYFQQLYYYGGDPTAAGLPAIQWPTSLENMPLSRQRAIESIAEMALQTQGQVVTPFGLQAETPRSALATLLNLASQAWDAIPGAFTGMFRGAPAGTTVSTATAPAAAPQAASAPTPPPAPTPQTQPQAQQQPRGASRDAAVQAIKNTLVQQGIPAQQAIQSLLVNRQQIVDAVGEEGWLDLWNWAQFNLPAVTNVVQAGGVDPLMVAIEEIRRAR